MDDSQQPAQAAADDQFLGAMGLEGLSDEEKQKALSDILYTLNFNVGMRVADSLNEQQLDDFEKFMNGDYKEEELAEWLQSNVPDYNKLIQEEAETMRDRTKQIVDKVMS